MQKMRAEFVEGCAKVNNIPKAHANKIFDLLEKFAGYGFNKAHAAAYASVAYQTAWLKAHYPVEFLAAMMTNDMASQEKVLILIKEGELMGIQTLPPDVNQSDIFFTSSEDKKSVLFALSGIKGVGEASIRAIVEERTRTGRSNRCRISAKESARKTSTRKCWKDSSIPARAIVSARHARP